MKVAITGGAGYIGSKLVPCLLSRGHQVKVVDIFPPTSQGDLYQAFVGDVTDTYLLRRALHDSDAAVHLAAILPRGRISCDSERARVHRVNYEGTVKVVNLCRELGISRFVFTSTCGSYGTTSRGPASEDDPVEATSPYTESKIEGEKYILESAGPGFHPVVLRLATVFGPSPRVSISPLFNSLVYEALTKGSIVVFGPNVWRPFVHIDDVVEAIAMVLDAPVDKISGEVLNVGSDHMNLRKIDAIKVIQKYLPKVEVEIERDPAEIRNYRVSFGKISRLLGFSAIRNFEDGMPELIDSIVEQYKVGDPK